MEDRSHRNSSRSTPEPFWQRLPSITFYPVRGAALYALIALTLCTLLGLLPGIGWILAIVVWVGVYRYAFEILRETANGRLAAPENTLYSSDGTVIRLLAMMILMGIFVVVVAAFLGPIVGLAALAAVVFLQPGCVISLAMDGSLRAALNPATPITLAVRIGWPYLAVFLLLFVIQASALTAGKWLHAVMPPIIGDLVLTFFSIWGLFATFHLLGYMVYQYHDVLGFEPEGAPQPLSRNAPDQALLDEAEHFVRDGHPEAAMDALRAAVRSRAVGLPVHELYHRLLRSKGVSDALREHGRQYITRLLAEKEERQAMQVLRELLETDPDFAPADPGQATTLAERARLSGQLQLQLDAQLAMLKAWPRAPLAPQWAVQAALLLAERYSRDDEARALLEDALGRCEDPEQRRKLEAAQRALSPHLA
jgi:hypothetical protein